MPDSFSPCSLHDVADACGTTVGKVKLFLIREDLYSSAVEGESPDAAITSQAACQHILRHFLDEEDAAEELAALTGKYPASSNGTASAESKPTQDRATSDSNEDAYLRAERIALVGLRRNRNNAIAQHRRGYAFLASSELDEDCHLWIENLGDDAKRFLRVSDGQVGRLPKVMPVLYFIPREGQSGRPTTEQLKTCPLRKRALVGVELTGSGEARVVVPGHDGDTHLWEELDDLDSGWYYARIWEAMPTDVEEVPSDSDALIVEPFAPFRWSGEPIDNLTAIRSDEHAVQPLIDGTAKRIVDHLQAKESEDQIDASLLPKIFDTLERQGAYFKEAVCRQIMHILNEKEIALPIASLRQLLSVAEALPPKTARLICHTLYATLDKQIDACALDLETDGHEIWEIGLATGTSSAEAFAQSSIPQGIKRVREATPAVWVGHNLQDWDRQALQNNDVELDETRIWDTLRVEALLSPRRSSLALDTTHKASDDATAAYRLFRTQVIRLLLRSCQELPVPLAALLAPLQGRTEAVDEVQALIQDIEPLHDALRKVCIEECDALLASSSLPSFVRRLQEHLEDIPTSETVHIIYPRPLHSLLEQFARIRFAGLPGGKHQQHVRAPNDEDSRDSYTTRLAAFYRHQCAEEGISPTVSGLTPWAQAHIRNHPEWIAPPPSNGRPSAMPNRWAVPVEAYLNADLDAPNHLIIIAPELIEAFSDTTVAHFEKEQLRDFTSRHDLWAKLDSGGSYCLLTEEQAQELGIPSDDPYVANGDKWLHRTPQGGYALLAYQENILEHIDANRPDDCSWREITLDGETMADVSCVRINTKGASTALHQQRLNPDTRQRARYWTVQSLLLRQLTAETGNSHPFILLTRGDDDLDALERFFRRQSWYVPEGGTLRRRLELVANYSQGRRLLIVPLERWTELMTQDLPIEAHVAVEAVPMKRQQALRRNFQIEDALDTLPTEGMMEASSTPEADELEQDEDTEAVEITDEEASKQRPYALQRGIYLIAPLLRWLTHTATTFHEEADLYVLDPRIEDIHLPNGPSLHIKRVETYGKKAYQHGLSVAKEYLPSPVQPEDITLPDDWRDTLARVFLPPEDDGSPSDFYDYQKPFLRPIMERRSDVLVELPTGSGKSVLFQAPALYHGLRHGLLTIVVTPLKALMVDQARALYEKGFLSSVDYVNGDLPLIETRDIYRRLASGELVLLYLAPERFRSRSFLTALKTRLEDDGTLCYFVFDEAHCVSLWGLDFRPDFLRPVEFVNEQRQRSDIYSFPCLMLSATITEQIHEHLQHLLYDHSSSTTRERGPDS